MCKLIMPFGAMLGLCALVLLAVVSIFGIPLNETHITEREHTQALELLPAYKSGVCEGKWVGYNITSGEVLVACGIPGTNPPQCLLVGYRVTENMGSTILTDEAYNTTAYVTDCYKAYKRTGFLDWDNAGTWVAAPLDLKAAIISAFGAP